MSAPGQDVTGLLQAWGAGDVAARDRLFAAVYPELRRRAAVRLGRERGRDSLQPTALVHEAYVRLVDQQRTAWQDRAHFFALASRMMRRILVDRARARQAAKRAGRWVRLALDESMAVTTGPDIDVIDLDRALTRLADLDPRKSDVAELRFFAGLSLEEIARLRSLSRATVERDWQAARAWLYKELSSNRTTGDA